MRKYDKVAAGQPDDIIYRCTISIDYLFITTHKLHFLFIFPDRYTSKACKQVKHNVNIPISKKTDWEPWSNTR